MLLSLEIYTFVQNCLIMKRYLFTFTLIIIAAIAAAQTVSPETLAKRAKRKNLTVKEWNTQTDKNGNIKMRWLDHITVYDSEGRKIEEIEYTTYGQKWREVYKYDENGLLIEEVEYNDQNKPYLIHKFKFNENGTKAAQYNYLPNGHLYSTKVFEYQFAE